jgi:hypothetical protein
MGVSGDVIVTPEDHGRRSVAEVATAALVLFFAATAVLGAYTYAREEGFGVETSTSAAILVLAALTGLWAAGGRLHRKR